MTPPPRPAARARRAPCLALLALASMLAACAEEAVDLAAGGAGSAAAAGPPRAVEPIAVSVAPLRRDAVSSVYSTSGTLRADKRATIMARTRGRAIADFLAAHLRPGQVRRLHDLLAKAGAG